MTRQDSVPSVPAIDVTGRRKVNGLNVMYKTPLVSVQVLTYNQAPYIAQAIEGALQQQTDFVFEIVVGEDCSTDRTREIVLAYQKEYPGVIRVITSEQNVGVAANSHRVHEACRGKYIAYCDGDDFWHDPSKLQRQVDYLEADSDVGLVHSGYHVHLNDKGITLRYSHRSNVTAKCCEPGDVFSGILLGQYPIGTCTVCVRKELVQHALERERDMFSDCRVLARDLCCWLSIARQCRFVYIDKALATYRVMAESAAHSRSRIGTVYFIESSEKIRLHFAEKYGCPEEIRRAVKHNYYRVVLNRAFHASDDLLARTAFRGLRDMDRRVPLQVWLHFLGATNRFIKALIRPFMIVRRSVLHVQRAWHLSMQARERTC